MNLRKAGTVSRLIKMVEKAQTVGFAVIMATEMYDFSDALDDFVSHAVVALRTGQACFGPLRHAEQLSKYNELVRIERVGQITYAGLNYRNFH